jgi:hypothetical protein
MMAKTVAQSVPAGRDEPVVARASTEYRVKRLIIVAMLVGMGGWFGYDGLVKWPAENQKIEQTRKDIEAARKANDEPKVRSMEADLGKLQLHTETDLRWQRVLAMILPPAGFFVLGWSLYYSRGSYRLRDNILGVPGHPPIPLDAVRAIDKTLWDRKGIVYIDYELANGKAGNACLDDFIYERKATDEIFKRIEVYTGTGETPESEPAKA